MPSEAADIQAKIQSLRPADASQRHARQTSIFWSGNRVSHRSGASIRHIVPQTWTPLCPGNCQLRTTRSRHANPHRRQRPRGQTNQPFIADATPISRPKINSETKTVNPSPVPSPEKATCGSAPGREVGVGNDKEKAQNEPLSKKKAAEWARIEDLDHNKINSLTQCQ